MERTFRRLNKPEVRGAFVRSHLANGIASQLRTLREHRGWSQSDLAKRLSTSQAVVSRLEDPSYGKFSVKTLLQIATAFDVALLVRFVSFSTHISQTWDTTAGALTAYSYEEEKDSISVISVTSSGGQYLPSQLADQSPTPMMGKYLVGVSPVDRVRPQEWLKLLDPVPALEPPVLAFVDQPSNHL